MNRNSASAPQYEKSDFSTCERCSGHFPGVGVRQDGHVYCCDKCAQGPSKKKMVRMLLPAVGLITVGFALGRVRYR